MNLISAQKSPIEIMANVTTASDAATQHKFIETIKRLYQYEIFKPLLDLTASLAYEKSLHFKIYDRKFFELDEGNCRTIANNVFDKIKNRFTVNKHYTITIKKTTADVIIHEISHMVEQEGDLSPLSGFAEMVQADIAASASTNLSLQAAVRQVIIAEVGNYKSSHTNSELFARYFQLMAMAKEVAGYGAEYGFDLQDLYRFFLNTSQWMWQHMYPKIIPKIDAGIANISQTYVKAIDDIQHKWSEEKINSFHKKSTSTQTGTPQWSKNVKSIKNPLS